MAVQPSIHELVTLLDSWRELPAYRMEPRVDAVAALFLRGLIHQKSGILLHDQIIPELPIRRGTLWGETTPGRNKSKKVDFALCAVDRSSVHLVEFKTDQRSRNELQDAYLAECGKRTFADVLAGIRAIQAASASEYAHKYGALENRLRVWGFGLDDRSIADAVGTCIRVWYLQPEAVQPNGIGFGELATHMDAVGGDLAREVAPYFRKWRLGPGVGAT